MTKSINKYGVPYHCYVLTLADGTQVTMDVGYEEDWGKVQQCTPGDCGYLLYPIGWGNDEDGHVAIVGVIDAVSGKSLNVRQWAERFVWSYVSNYSSP